MNTSATEAYDRVARKIWRVFVVCMILPGAEMIFRTWVWKDDKTRFYLALAMALFWGVLAVPFLFVYIRRGFRERTMPITNATGLLWFPLVMSMRLPGDIIRDCGGSTGWQMAAWGVTSILLLLLFLWSRSVCKEYQACTPLENSPPAYQTNGG